MKAMGEAERSIAVKRKFTITKSTSKITGTSSEIYTPKAGSSKHEETPPPYIPSKKLITGKMASSKDKTRTCLSRNDARHILDREEEKEVAAQSHRKDLLKSLGINYEARSYEKKKEISTGTVVFKREIRDEKKKEKVQNFQITTHLVPIQDNLEDPIQSDEEMPVTKVSKVSLSSRMGKVITKKNNERGRKQEVTFKVKTQVKDGKIDLSRLGKALVKKQCEAAVMSVKAAQKAEMMREVPDSRVVRCDSEESEESIVKEEINDGRNVSQYEEIKKVSRKASTEVDEVEDLAEMISNDKEESLNDEFTLDLDDEDLSHVIDLEEVKQDDDKDNNNSKGTRFIVTLDGMDEGFVEPKPDIIMESVGIQKEQIMSSSFGNQVLISADSVPQPTYFEQPQHIATNIYSYTATKKIAPPKVQPFSISLKDSDDEYDGKLDASYPVQGTDKPTVVQTAIQKAKMSERCKFWPACVAGSECEFHHPTTHCKTFPNCKFGDKCLFIHPNCRFDSKCTKPDCPYTHTSKRPNLSSGAALIAIPKSQAPFKLMKPYSDSQQTICRFYPNCHNVNCYFVHPKPCRFGMSCLSPNCPFYHPALPTKDKLKWQSEILQSKPALTKLPVKETIKKTEPTQSTATVSTGSFSVSSTSQ